MAKKSLTSRFGRKPKGGRKSPSSTDRVSGDASITTGSPAPTAAPNAAKKAARTKHKMSLKGVKGMLARGKTALTGSPIGTASKKVAKMQARAAVAAQNPRLGDGTTAEEDNQPTPLLKLQSRIMINPLCIANNLPDSPKDPLVKAPSEGSLVGDISAPKGPQFFTSRTTRQGSLRIGGNQGESSFDLVGDVKLSTAEEVEVGEEEAKLALPTKPHTFEVMVECLHAVGIFDHKIIDKCTLTRGKTQGYTVFAPTDDAFARVFALLGHFGPVTVQVLKDNERLRHMVKSLIVKGAVRSSFLFDKQCLTTIGGSRITINRTSAGVVSIVATDGTAAKEQPATCIKFDTKCTHGWLHAIDSVPTPGPAGVAGPTAAAPFVTPAKVGESKSTSAPARAPFTRVNRGPSAATSPTKGSSGVGAIKQRPRRGSSLKKAPFTGAPDKVQAAKKRFGVKVKSNANSCHGCNKTVYTMEKMVVDKTVWHKSCFKCTECKCQLAVKTYAGLHGNFYCKPHFKRLFQLKGNYDEGFGHSQHKTKWMHGVVN